MEPDRFQQAWQAQASQTRVTIDVDSLRKEVERAQQNFQTMIFWRDFREVGVALVLLPLWFYLGIKSSQPWTWYLSVPALIWTAGFMVAFRMRRQRKSSEPGEPLLYCVKDSLTDVEDQIWLLRNVFWWYLMPLGVAILIYFAHASWRSGVATNDWWSALGFGGFLFTFLFGLYAFIYYVNQRAVDAQLVPRRQELMTLLASLQEEATGEGGEEQIKLPSLPFAEDKLQTACASPARVTFSMFAFAVVMLLVVGFLVVMVNTDSHVFTGKGYPKKAPFTEVRWQEYQPEVKLGKEWFRLVSVDELPVSEIVAFSRRTYRDLWRKRFEEDLVELLTGLKHPPGDKVTLTVQSLTSQETQVREDVPMTYANRQAIRAAARQREDVAEPERERAKRPAVPIENRAQFRERIDEFLQLARVRTGFSGVVLVARGGEPVYEGAFGYSHLASRIPNSLDTPFRIASLSKQFTAAAILSLDAEGKLRIDDPVYRYLPEFTAEPYNTITIYHLLTHTSGLPRVPEDAARHARWDAMSETTTPVDDYVRLACECPLKFEPGKGYLYSNFGYRVLAALIAHLTDEEYADFMEKRLFKPLGLRESGVARISRSPDEAKIAEVVSLLSLNRRTSEPSFVTTDRGRNYGTGYGSGGIYASANDLLRWDRVLAGDSFLSAEQKAKLFQPVREHYACGWIVKKSDLDGRIYQTHSGANEGYFSQMMRVPEDDLVIIALGNVRKTDEIDDALEQLFRLCRSLPYQDP